MHSTPRSSQCFGEFVNTTLATFAVFQLVASYVHRLGIATVIISFPTPTCAPPSHSRKYECSLTSELLGYDLQVTTNIRKTFCKYYIPFQRKRFFRAEILLYLWEKERFLFFLFAVCVIPLCSLVILSSFEAIRCYHGTVHWFSLSTVDVPRKILDYIRVSIIATKYCFNRADSTCFRF